MQYQLNRVSQTKCAAVPNAITKIMEKYKNSPQGQKVKG